LALTRDALVGGKPIADTGDVYYTYWFKFQPDLHTQLDVEEGRWRVLSACKTVGSTGGDNGDYRVITHVYQDSSNNLYWNIQGDENALWTTPLHILWQVQNKIVPVPVGEYRLSEIKFP
jgi:hypothetical protein